MLQFDVSLCRARDNVAHKVRRYIHFEPPRVFRRLCYVSPATMTGTSCLW